MGIVRDFLYQVEKEPVIGSCPLLLNLDIREKIMIGVGP
jgi:hypothetical protein